MAVKHKRIDPSKGEKALQALRDDIKETLGVIQEEAEIDQQIQAGRVGDSGLSKRFPVLNR